MIKQFGNEKLALYWLINSSYSNSEEFEINFRVLDDNFKDFNKKKLDSYLNGLYNNYESIVIDSLTIFFELSVISLSNENIIIKN